MIPVTEMSRAIAFYCDALGLPLLGNNADDTWAEVGDASVRFALHAGATTGVPTGVGILVQDIDATCRAVVAHGGRLAHGSSVGDPVVSVQDPDGNVIQLMTGGAGTRR
jgi:catechol 2,3-dioxygenase-like lactoylglutathione lyase family enzyme